MTEAHDDKLWSVLDDVQRALAKGLYGRTLAIAVLRQNFPPMTAREAALEEAAKVADNEITRCFSQSADGRGSSTARRIRDAIRALIPATPKPDEIEAGGMVERVVRALAKNDGHDPDEMRGRLDVDGKWPVWHAYRSQARAAIAALPTATVREAALERVLRRLVADFEADFCIEGCIVDQPDPMLKTHYVLACAALRAQPEGE